MFRTDGCNLTIFCYIQNHRSALNWDVQFLDAVDKPLGVFRPGEFFLEPVQAESGVNALLKNSAGGVVAFENQHVFAARFSSRRSRGKTCRPSSDNQYINFLIHIIYPPGKDGKEPSETLRRLL